MFLRRVFVFCLLLGVMTGKSHAADWRPLSGQEIQRVLPGYEWTDNTGTTLQIWPDGRAISFYKGEESSRSEWNIQGDQYCTGGDGEDHCYDVQASENAIRFRLTPSEPWFAYARGKFLAEAGSAEDFLDGVEIQRRLSGKVLYRAATSGISIDFRADGIAVQNNQGRVEQRSWSVYDDMLCLENLRCRSVSEQKSQVLFRCNDQKCAPLSVSMTPLILHDKNDVAAWYVMPAYLAPSHDTWHPVSRDVFLQLMSIRDLTTDDGGRLTLRADGILATYQDGVIVPQDDWFFDGDKLCREEGALERCFGIYAAGTGIEFRYTDKAATSLVFHISGKGE